MLDDREITRHPYDPEMETVVGRDATNEMVPLHEQNTWGNTWLIEQFVEWLDGGAKMTTNVEDNLQSVALIEAARQSSRTGEPIEVQQLLAETREKV